MIRKLLWRNPEMQRVFRQGQRKRNAVHPVPVRRTELAKYLLVAGDTMPDWFLFPSHSTFLSQSFTGEVPNSSCISTRRWWFCCFSVSSCWIQRFRCPWMKNQVTTHIIESNNNQTGQVNQWRSMFRKLPNGISSPMRVANAAQRGAMSFSVRINTNIPISTAGHGRKTSDDKGKAGPIKKVMIGCRGESNRSAPYNAQAPMPLPIHKEDPNKNKRISTSQHPAPTTSTGSNFNDMGIGNREWKGVCAVGARINVSS